MQHMGSLISREPGPRIQFNRWTTGGCDHSAEGLVVGIGQVVEAADAGTIMCAENSRGRVFGPLPVVLTKDGFGDILEFGGMAVGEVGL